MTLHQTLTDRFLAHLLATPRGRAHVLNQLADAESSGEARIFEQALARVDDPKLSKMIARHQADELRHAELFRACVERNGTAPYAPPPELRVMDRLDRALGGFLARPIEDSRGVMEAYLLLQVVEERAVDQFAVLRGAFERAGDNESARVLDEVARDEARHLRYCHAIARRYAPDEATRRATLARFRRVEARAFGDNGLANLRYTLARGYAGRGAARAAWTAVAWFNAGLRAVAPGALPFTSFAGSDGGDAQGADDAVGAAVVAA